MGIFFTPFQIGLKHGARVQTQRPTKVLISYRERLNALVVDIQKNEIVKQIDSTLHKKSNFGTILPNALILLKKNQSSEIVLNARHLNSNTNHSSVSRPPEISNIAC